MKSLTTATFGIIEGITNSQNASGKWVFIRPTKPILKIMGRNKKIGHMQTIFTNSVNCIMVVATENAVISEAGKTSALTLF